MLWRFEKEPRVIGGSATSGSRRRTGLGSEYAAGPERRRERLEGRWKYIGSKEGHYERLLKQSENRSPEAGWRFVDADVGRTPLFRATAIWDGGSDAAKRGEGTDGPPGSQPAPRRIHHPDVTDGVVGVGAPWPPGLRPGHSEEGGETGPKRGILKLSVETQMLHQMCTHSRHTSPLALAHRSQQMGGGGNRSVGRVPEGAKDASTVTVGGAWSPGKVGPRVPSLKGEPSEPKKKETHKKFKKIVACGAKYHLSRNLTISLMPPFS